MWRALFYVSFLFACIAAGLAQDRALISGDVEDTQDVPVSGVTVTLQNPTLRVERTSTTNADGFYFFAEVSPAEGYIVAAAAPGKTFAPQSVQFNVEVGETRHLLPSFVVGNSSSPVSGLPPRGLMGKIAGDPLAKDFIPFLRSRYENGVRSLDTATTPRPLFLSAVATAPPRMTANIRCSDLHLCAKTGRTGACEPVPASDLLPRVRQPSRNLVGQLLDIGCTGRHEKESE